MLNKSLAIIAILLCALLVEQAAAAEKNKQSSKIKASDGEESNSPVSITKIESDEKDFDDKVETKKNPTPSRSKSIKRRYTTNTKKSAPKGKSTVTKTAAMKRDAKPSKEEVISEAENARFVLPNFEKSLVTGTGPLKRKWETEQYTVDYDRRNKNEIALNWKKGSDEVNIAVSTGGNISQTFIFGNSATITLSLNSNGKIVQDWKMNGTQYVLVKNPNGGTIRIGGLSEKATNEYKKLISAWCKENDYFVGKSNCVVY